MQSNPPAVAAHFAHHLIALKILDRLLLGFSSFIAMS